MLGTVLTKPAQVALICNESRRSFRRLHFNEESLDGVIDSTVVKLVLSRLILLEFSCEDFALSGPGFPCFAGSDSGNLADALTTHRVGPIEIKLGARALPVHLLPSNEDSLRVGLAVLVACHCKELPSVSGVLDAYWRLLLVYRDASFLLVALLSFQISHCHTCSTFHCFLRV